MSAGCLAALAYDHVEAFSLSSMSDVSVRDATDAFDHILLGAPDLDLGIRWVEKRTGVRANYQGGRITARAMGSALPNNDFLPKP